MLTPTVAAVTIGQSPRTDVVPEMAAHLPGARWVEAGALDDLDDAAIAGLAPGGADFPLVTKLRSGKTAVVGERAVVPALQAAVERVDRDADVLIVLCSGTFPLRSRIPLIYPGAVLAATVGALYHGARLLVLTPHEGQVATQHARWRERGVAATVMFASPYAGADFARLGREARSMDTAAVVLDCIGYSLAAKAIVAAASGRPTLLVRSLAARVVAELLGMPPVCPSVP
jgi:protein AroM